MKITIGQALGLGFGIMLILLIAISVVGVVNVTKAQTLTNDILELQELGEAIDELAIAHHSERLGLIDYIISGEEEEKAEIEEAHEEYEFHVVHLQMAQGFPELAGQIESMIQLTADMDVLLDEVLDAYEANPNDITAALELLPELDEYNDSLVEPAIDGVDIPQSDIDRIVQPQLKILAEQSAQLPSTFAEQYAEQLREKVLEKTIRRHLLDQKVKEAYKKYIQNLKSSGKVKIYQP